MGIVPGEKQTNDEMVKVCICGGGNEGHCIAGYLSHLGHSVNILTRSPEQWKSELQVTDHFNNQQYISPLNKVSSNPAEVIPESEIVLISIPAFAFRDVISNIAPHLTTQTIVALPGSGGFDYICSEIIPKDTQQHIAIAASQRVPVICRTSTYGISVDLLGFCHGSMKYAVRPEHRGEEICQQLRDLFQLPSELIPSFLCINCMNSNSLLHTTRLYAMLQKPDEVPALFYADWDDAASELLIACDQELHQFFANAFPDISFNSIKPILLHYESTDAASLTKKIRSIPSLHSIKTPRVEIAPNKYALDFESRYFTADFPYGIALILLIANRHKYSVPTIEKVTLAGLQACGWSLDRVANELFPTLAD
eukprot:c2651_g1_i1.p1 GENE.c2651_g1_i1~~c2651_g1_i1.p1  ORF type:complete len:367 (-),score=73.78 c2651_g1_i1:107-1207(-)